MSFFAFLAGVGSVLGGIVLVLGFVTAKGAPQEAAIAALAIALAVLPYVFYRVLQLNSEVNKAKKFREEVLLRLDLANARKPRTDSLDRE